MALLILLLQLHFLPSAALLSESLALLALKNSISDDPHSSLSSWTAAAGHCTFAGVTCNNRRQVIGLHLAGLNLSGTLSPDLASLRFLTNISFAFNKFSGPIPPAISSISTLRHLNLSNNFFNGSIPPALKNLQVLDVYNNNMSGDFPIGVSEMTNLRYLNLGGNFFTGRIPSEVGRWEFLEYFAVQGNDLEGPIPPEIGNLTKLRELYIGYYNNFDGGIPPEIGNLSELVRFDAASCGLSGKLPPELGKLQKLNTLYLQLNALSGPLPELGGLKSIRELDLSCNMLDGEIPGSFSELKNLTLLNLFTNKFSGSIPGFIGDLPKLEVLQLWNNSFTDSIPLNLGRSGTIRLVDFAFNKLTGAIPSDICYGNLLEILIVMGNFLSGPLPESLGNCFSLKRVLIWGNALNGTIPKGLLSLPNLTEIELHDNLLSGEFPTTDSVSLNLLQISLSNNKLYGSLPPSIGNFLGVQKLLLDRNKFSGHIPLEIGRLQKISRINFSHNKLSGPIAPEISGCKHLIFLDLSGNELSGEIPKQIFSMRLLNYLNLSRNHLVGSVPASVVNMQSLTSVDFSYNNLSGLVMGTGQLGFFNYTSFLGNPDLCGPYLGPCKDANRHNQLMKRSLKLLLAVGLSLGLMVVAVAVAVAVIIKTRSLKRARQLRNWKLTAFQRLDFTVEDVLSCLKEENITAKGGDGIGYQGVMSNGDQVTVKRFPTTSYRPFDDRGFNGEIEALGRIRHRHIVRLLGFCWNRETSLLVYEFMPNGSLYEILHGKKGGHLLWETRYKIAIETGKGLCYLHHHCSPPIVHLAVTSNNILLDTNFDAQLANSGLAKLLQDSGSSKSLSAIDSFGYVAAEHVYTQDPNEKGDVYSFGVVLLELISGRKPTGEFGDGVDIVQWVRKTRDSKKEIIDARLSSVPLHEAMHVLNVAILCTEEQAMKRPTMREVVQILAELQQQPSSNQQQLPL